jgi:selenocysteine-specific elongation factor
MKRPLICCKDEIELLPIGIETRARSLESYGCAVAQAVAGQRVGINLHRVSVEEVRRGMSLGAPGSICPLYLLNAEIGIITAAQNGIKNRQRMKIYLGTAITNALVVLMEKDHLQPGESGLAQIRLMRPVAALPGDAFVISPLSINTVIAGGRVLETAWQKYRRANSESVLPVLSALQKRDMTGYVGKLFAGAQGRLISAKTLSQRTGLPQTSFEGIINAKVQKGAWVYFKGRGAIEKRHLSLLRRQFIVAMEEVFSQDPMKKSVGVSEIAERLAFSVEESLLKITADALCAEGDIVNQNGGYRPADYQPALNASQESQVALLLDCIHQVP